MAHTISVSIRMDADLKEQADALFHELGMSLTIACNIFARQALREGGIPFPIRLTNHEEQTDTDPADAISGGDAYSGAAAVDAPPEWKTE